ncbi:MAG TPA: Ger(x)C family spore germination protein [Desulfitobacteriaceae bacterium]|nr:Ger(x)C family spore germination protein [Desulfitobacteriaceae bacterium]
MARGRILFLLLILVCIFSISGCWDKRELNEITLTSALAVETTPEGQYRVIVQNINPQGSNPESSKGTSLGSEKSYTNIIAEGDSIYEALNKLSRLTPSKLFFAHTNLIIVSEDLARDRGVRDILDYFERSYQFRKDLWFVIGKGNPLDLMEASSKLSYIPSQMIFEIIKSNKNSTFFVALQLGQFIRLLQDESTQPYTAGVEIQSNISDKAGDEANEENSQPQFEIVLKSTAIFHQDKLVGWLDQKESSGFQWIRGEHKSGMISFADPEDPEKQIGTRVLNNKTKLKPQIENGQITLKIEIEFESYLAEAQGDADLFEPSVITDLEIAQEEQVNEEVRAVLQKAQKKYKADIFGFGEKVHHSDPELWDELKAVWSEVFPGVAVDIQVKSKIRHTTEIVKRAEPPEK